MKRIIYVAAGLVLMVATDYGRAQTTQPGPGEGGSILKDPDGPPVAQPQNPTSAPNNYVESLLDKTPPGGTPAVNPLAGKLASLASFKVNTLNDAIKIEPKHGSHVIFIQCYSGDDCHLLARQLVIELRSTYKLPAYTFNTGAEEKQKEYARVMEIIEKKKEFYRKNGVPADVPIRVGFVNIQEQCAVLLGGYSSEGSAKRALDGLRQLKPPDPTKVKLDVQFFGNGKANEYGKLEGGEGAYVNPFQKAFLGHNPTIKQERPADWDKLDMGLLQKLNAGESFSLLNCKKPFTLAIKEYQTPAIVQTKNAPGSFLESLSLKGNPGLREDAAAKKAHYLAEGLRKAKWEAFVLHTKYSSIVCVGGYDSLEEPGLKTMANIMETKVLPDIFQLYPESSVQAVVQFRVIPMKIPR